MPSDTKKWDEMLRRVREAARRDARVKVGLLASSGRHPDSDLSIVEIGAVHEFGSEAANIPERSWLRRTYDLKRDEIKAQTEKIAKAYVTGKLELDQALEVLGQWMSAQVKNTIRERQVVPRLEDSPAGRRTIARKGSSLTLVDTAQMLNAITYEVDE